MSAKSPTVGALQRTVGQAVVRMPHAFAGGINRSLPQWMNAPDPPERCEMQQVWRRRGLGSRYGSKAGLAGALKRLSQAHLSMLGKHWHHGSKNLPPNQATLQRFADRLLE